MRRLFLISILSFGVSSWAQSSNTQTTGASATATTPLQVCTELVNAAKADNFEQAKKYMMMPEHKKQASSKSKQRFERMHDKYLKDIQNTTCSQEQIAGDHAVVTATSESEKRFIPFVQKEGQWMFDMKTYHSFYSMDAKMGDKMGKKSKSM